MSNEQEFKERLEFLGRTYSSIVYSFITFFINITILYAKGYLPLSPVEFFIVTTSISVLFINSLFVFRHVAHERLSKLKDNSSSN